MSHVSSHYDPRETAPAADPRHGDPVLDTSRAARMLQNATAESGWLVQEVRSAEVISERPDRRRTIRYRVSARRAGAPFSEVTWHAHQYRSAEGERMMPVLRFLRAAAAPEIRVPTPVGYARESRLLLMTSMEGRPLTGVLEDPIESRVAASLKRLGRALASFHAIRSPGPSARSTERPQFGRWDGAAEAQALEATEARLRESGLEPRVLERLREGAAALRSELADEAGVARSPSMVHRHLRPEHLIFGSDGISMVDLDQASFGEPENDLGTLIATMVLADLKRAGGARQATARADALRAGYLAGGVLRPNRLAAYTSAALLHFVADDKMKNGGVGAPDWARLTAVVIDEALPELTAARAL